MNKWSNYRLKKEQMLDSVASLVKKKSKVCILIKIITIHKIWTHLLANLITVKEQALYQLKLVNSVLFIKNSYSYAIKRRGVTIERRF